MTSKTTFSSTYGAAHRSGDRPWCDTCGTDEFLIIETIRVPAAGPSGKMDVSYTCTGCDGFYAHPVQQNSLDPEITARMLPGPSHEPPGYYTHCGEPMTLGTPGTHRLASERTDTEHRLLEAYLQTQVLHCHCGFQMELPRTGNRRSAAAL